MLSYNYPPYSPSNDSHIVRGLNAIEIDRVKAGARRETGTRFSIVSAQMCLTHIGNPLNTFPDRRAKKEKDKEKEKQARIKSFVRFELSIRGY